MEKIKKLLAELSDAEFQAVAKPIEETEHNGKFYFEHIDKVTKERSSLCMIFTHRIYRDFWKTEFTYGMSVHIDDENGPLYPLDRLNMEITRELDNANYTVGLPNTAEVYHVRTFKGGPSGTSCLVPVVIHQGYEYRWVQMCQSANRSDQFVKKELLHVSN